MADREAGERLKRAIHVGRARNNILYDTDLSIRSGVSYDTLMNWFGGKTVPRGAELRRVGQAIGITYAELMAAYEGHDPEPPPLQDAIKELVVEMRLSRAQQDEATLALLQAVAALLPRGREPGETPDGTGHEAPAGKRR